MIIKFHTFNVLGLLTCYTVPFRLANTFEPWGWWWNSV